MGKGLKALRLMAMIGAVVLLAQRTLLANQPMGPQAMLATMSIVPFTMLLFILTGTGAAVLSEARKKQEALGALGNKRRYGLDFYRKFRSRLVGRFATWGCSRLFFIAIIFFVLFVLSGVNEGFGPIWCILFSIFTAFKSFQMFKYGGKRPRGVPPDLKGTKKVRVIAIACGVVVIVFAIFCTGVSIAAVGYFEGHSGKAFAVRRLRILNLQEKLFYEKNGRYDTEDVVSLFAWEQGYYAAQVSKPQYLVELKLLEDGQSYMATAIDKSMVRPWPYSILFPAVSLYTDQTGVITVREVRTASGRAGPQDTSAEQDPAFSGEQRDFYLPTKLKKRDN